MARKARKRKADFEGIPILDPRDKRMIRKLTYKLGMRSKARKVWI